MPIDTKLTVAVESLRVAAPAADLLAIPIRATAVDVPGGTAEVDDRYAAELTGLLPVDVAELLAYHEAKGDAGEIIATPVQLAAGVAEVLLFGTGDGAAGALRRAGAQLARRAKGRTTLAVAAPAGDHAAFTEGLLLGSYGFRIGAAAKKTAVQNIVLAGGDDNAVSRGTTTARATALARDLANTPSLDKSPAWLADRAKEIAAESGLTFRVRDENELRAAGFGGLIAVGAGSARPPRLIELSYEPAGAARHVVLVGKGITFDSGGLSLKPNDNMKTMKTDMSGGAVVMAVMSALRAMGVSARVTGLVAAAENMPSGSAMRPSDVITHFGGKTSEVLNTDAEGRLVLADALAYADAELDPDVVVDIATLTGAAKVALGLRYAALYATDDDLATALTQAGAASGERLWRLPLSDDYREGIESDVADVANIGHPTSTGEHFGAGSIMAALFLREFAGARRWAHLDVAGPGRATGDDAEITKGATGFGVRGLLQWLAADTDPSSP